MPILITTACALALGLLVTPLVRLAARRHGFVASPREDRWHRKPTAILGGVAIYVTFIAIYLSISPRVAGVIPVLLAASLLFLLGLIDDVVRIKPQTKLVGQLIAAAIVVQSGLHLRWTRNDALNSLITILWLVGITNAINLLDNMDGLAAGISGIACLFLTITFLLNGQVTEAFIPAILGGVILSFLVFNFNPASIFMGDSGSMFLGFMLSATALLSDSGRTRDLTSVLITPVLILMIPIFDTCVVIISRKLNGRAVSDGGCDHTSHRLVAMGMTERRAVVMFYLFAGVSGTLALFVRLLRPESVRVLIPAFTLLVLLLGLQFCKVRVYDEGSTTARGLRFVSAIADFSYKRRILEVLLDMVLVVLAYYGAFLLYFRGSLPAGQVTVFNATIPLVIAVQMTFFWLGGMYRGTWRYARKKDVFMIAKSVLAGTGVSALLMMLMSGFTRPSSEVVMVNIILLLAFVAASRLSFRVLRNLIPGRPRLSDQAVSEHGSALGGEMMFQDIVLRTAVGLGVVLILATAFSFSSLAAPQTGDPAAKSQLAEKKRPTIAGSITGSGQISVNGNAVTSGTTILSDSSISTGPNGYATVDLASLGQVKLAPGSAINLAVEANRVRVDLLRGSVVQSLTAQAKGELGMPDGKTGVTVARGQVALATGGLTLNTGDRRVFAGAGRAVISGNSLVTATIGGTESRTAAVDSRRPGAAAAGARQTPARSLTSLTVESAKGAYRQVSGKPETEAEATAVQPGNPRRPPASPTRP